MKTNTRAQALQAPSAHIKRLDLRPTGRRAHPSRKPRQTLEQRYHAKIKPDANGCLIWTGAKDMSGYGSFNGTMAHRVGYELRHGVKLLPHQSVMHECPHGDNKACQLHTRLGTQHENMKQAADAGLLVRFKLNPTKAQEIVRLWAQGVSHAELEKRYGVKAQSIQQVVKGESYRKHTAELREEFKEELAWFSQPKNKRGGAKPFPGRAKAPSRVQHQQLEATA